MGLSHSPYCSRFSWSKSLAEMEQILTDSELSEDWQVWRRSYPRRAGRCLLHTDHLDADLAEHAGDGQQGGQGLDVAPAVVGDLEVGGAHAAAAQRRIQP